MNKNTKGLRSFVIGNLDVLTTLFLTLLLVIFFTARNSLFLSLGNLFNLVQQNAALCIVATGMTFVIISGNMDLSSGSIIVLTACLAGVVFRETSNILLALAACVALAALIGVFNGWLISYLGINAVIVTLATMIWARGLALGITGASSIAMPAPVFQTIYYPFLFRFINISLVIVVVVFLVGWLLLTRTRFGRYTKALGEDEKATELAGINTRRIKWLIFVLAAVLVGVASVVDLARLGSAVTTIGYNMELNAIVAVVIGGNKLSGGEGSFSKTITGLLFMCVLSNGLSTLGVTDDYFYLIQGGIILAALAIQMLFQNQRAAQAVCRLIR